MNTKILFVCVLALALLCGHAHAGVTDGLVAYYPFNGDGTDKSGNGRDATFEGDVEFLDGKVGKALSLTGTAFARLPDPGSYTEATIGGWIMWRGFNACSRFFDFGIQKYAMQVFNDQNTGTLCYDLHFGDETNQCLPDFAIQLNHWYHIMLLVSNTAGAKLYINGQLMSEAPTLTESLNNLDDAANYFLGRSNWPGDGYFNGLIDEFRIYSRNLSQSEIQQLYKGQIPQMLTVSKTGSGTGAVASSPSGINCGSTCTAGFNKGKKVTLTPAPDSGSVFTGWTGGCLDDGKCAVVMSGDVTVEAAFDIGSCAYTITPRSKTLGREGSKIPVKVTASGYTYCPRPSVEINPSDSDWITYTASSLRDNKGLVIITVSRYSLSTPRTTSLTIGGNTLDITQTGVPCAISLSPASSELLDSLGDTGSFTVTVTPADCPWTAAPDVHSSSWVTVDPGSTSGKGSGTISYTVSTNTTGKPKQGHITVTTTNKKSKSYLVKQAK